MDAHSHLFGDLTYIFLAATVGGFLAWRVHLPLVIGFVLGGIVISPFTPGIKLHDIKIFHELAEAGVVLLMFSIGVEFSVPDLLAVKWVAIGGCMIGVSTSIGLALLAAKIMGWSTTQGVVVGATIAVASTMVLARLLADRGAMNTTFAKVCIGISLVEDLAVVMMTVVLPSFASSDQDRFTKAAWTLGKAVLLLIPLAFMAMKLVPSILRWARKSQNEELMLLIALSISLGTAALAQTIGFSQSLGAFLAGLAISNSPDLHEAHDRLLPIRDVFVALFFVSLGTLIEPEVVRHNLPLLGVMLILIIPGKFIVWLTVIKLFGYSTRNALAAAVGLTQIGELSFVIVQTAMSAGMVGDNVFNATLAASLISIFVNVLAVRAVLRWIERKWPDQPIAPASISPTAAAEI